MPEVGIVQVFWQSASMLQLPAQPGPPVLVDVDVPVVSDPELLVEPAVVVAPPAPPALTPVPELLVVVVACKLPPTPPNVAPVSLEPEQAAMAEALNRDSPMKASVTCFTGGHVNPS
jgi:hypothetical protein